VADEVGGRPHARRRCSRWHGSARTSFDGVLELQGLSCKTSSRWRVAATWLAHTIEHVVSGVEERLQLGDRPCGGIVTCKGCHTARRLASETEDSRRLGRRACCAQDGEKGRLVALTVASVKVWLRGSMAEAPGRRRCGGPGRRGRGPKAPRRGTGPPARSGDSTGFSASTAGATKPNIPADAWVLDATRSRQLGSLREVAPCSSSSPRRGGGPARGGGGGGGGGGGAGGRGALCPTGPPPPPPPPPSFYSCLPFSPLTSGSRGLGFSPPGRQRSQGEGPCGL
jgi:hypothetical protein